MENYCYQNVFKDFYLSFTTTNSLEYIDIKLIFYKRINFKLFQRPSMPSEMDTPIEVSIDIQFDGWHNLLFSFSLYQFPLFFVPNTANYISLTELVILPCN